MYRPAAFRTLVPLMLLGAATALAPAIASAATSAVPDATISESRVVHYHDLDLSRPADAARLYARIRHAAAQVCASDFGGSPQRDCYDAAVAAAVARINKPLLSGFHRQLVPDNTRAAARNLS